MSSSSDLDFSTILQALALWDSVHLVLWGLAALVVLGPAVVLVPVAFVVRLAAAAFPLGAYGSREPVIVAFQCIAGMLDPLSALVLQVPDAALLGTAGASSHVLQLPWRAAAAWLPFAVVWAALLGAVPRP